MRPIVLKTKYAFHLLASFLKPQLILDIGSMDGADSKRFARLVPEARIIAFEANPYNYTAMCADAMLERSRIRVENLLVSDVPGRTRFFVQKPLGNAANFNRGTSSTLQRSVVGAQPEEVVLDAVRIDEYVVSDYPSASKVAAWVDVEGYSYGVLKSMGNIADAIKLIHVEVETEEIWPGQKLEDDVLKLASSMGFVQIARGFGDVQRDVILANTLWYEQNRKAIERIVAVARLVGPAASRIVESRGWHMLFSQESA
ncbi:MAG: FkbM family methyltransferase [Betaproteobacteria bacterium]|nr:MAG: FkbM family methyltransferase [Betaproteobacteria bacterium]